MDPAALLGLDVTTDVAAPTATPGDAARGVGAASAASARLDPTVSVDRARIPRTVARDDLDRRRRGERVRMARERLQRGQADGSGHAQASRMRHSRRGIASV